MFSIQASKCFLFFSVSAEPNTAIGKWDTYHYYYKKRYIKGLDPVQGVWLPKAYT